MTRRKDSREAKKRILSACVKLFIENGYRETKMSDIIEEANVSNSSFQNLFRTKDGVLMDLVEFMFSNQFDIAHTFVPENAKNSYIYAAETAIQMTLTELNENLREIYVEAYTHPKTAEYIFQRTSSELYSLFSENLPGFSESDFYELEIGTAGIMRSYMTKPCDKYFTLEKKLSRFLEMTLTVYKVPEDERKAIIDYILGSDIKKVASGVMQKLFDALAMHFDFEFDK